MAKFLVVDTQLELKPFWVLQNVFLYLTKQRPIDSYALEVIVEAQRKVLRLKK